MIDDDEPCYILFRTDEPRGRHFEHILVTWQPDEAPVSKWSKINFDPYPKDLA